MQAVFKNIRISAPAAFAAILALYPAAGGEEIRQKYFCEDIKIPFFSVSRASDGTKKIRTARPHSIPAEFSIPKPEKTARVFIVGESAAGLLANGNRFLSRFLNKAFPGKTIEIINCGMSTYESRRILSVFEETLAYEPDLLIVLSGNNEAGWDFCPGINAEAGRRVRKIKTRLASIYMPPEDASTEVSIAIHEDRLRVMAGLARKRGTPVLFCTLPVNLRDFAPSGFPPDGLDKGIRLASEKDPRAALEFFRQAGSNSREPFALFYSGRALERLGRMAEAGKSYAAAVKYDSASDRCSGERNAMIRRVAQEEGECLADLEAAFSGIARNGITGGTEITDGVHWFKKYTPFVSAVIARAAQTCPYVNGKGGVPAPDLLVPARGYSPEDFSEVFSYTCDYARDQAALRSGAEAVSERIVVMLERLCRMDCGKLDQLLFNPDALKKEILYSVWNPSLREDTDAWRPALLRSAAEIFRRTGRSGAAARAADAIPGADARNHSKKTAPTYRPLREGEDEAKRLSDLAVKKILEGRLTEARPLLAQAAEKDGDSLEVRMNACSLAARIKDAVFGEEHCGDAVSLAAYPPKHARLVPDGAAAAFYSRAYFRLETGNKAGCEDLRHALEKASPAWPLGGEARSLAAKRCP